MRLQSVIALLLLTASATIAQTYYHHEVKKYALELYTSFSKTQKQTALLSFQDTARLMWNNLPVGLRARSGASVGNMTNPQRQLVHRILSAALSSQGYLKATGIMHLDELINRFYDSMYVQKQLPDNAYAFIKNLQWSPKNYYFAFFGSPIDRAWGFKLEGHHLSVNFTFDQDAISVTPFFVGTDPAEFLNSEYAGWRVLGQEEDMGLKLARSFTEAQKKKAIASQEVPRDIITAAESGKRLVDQWGIAYAALDRKQKEVLLTMVREFVFNLEHDKAQEEFKKIEKAGLDKIYFGWIGAMEEKQPHYYIINGPTFLIEFDNNGGPRESANHIHAIWREKGNEYGEDVLKNHYQAEKH
jgi:Protein of unknown function (DUF3500)